MTERTTTSARAMAMSGALAVIIATAPTMAAEAGGRANDLCAVASAAHAIVCPVAADPMVAADKPIWQRRTDSAYLTVYAHYCAPGLAHLAADAPGIEVALYSDRFRIEYGADCRNFYLNEIAARIQ